MIWGRTPWNCQTHLRCQKVVCFFSKKNNGRIIRPESAFVLCLEARGSLSFCRTRLTLRGVRCTFPWVYLIGSHKTQHTITTVFIITYMLWGPDHCVYTFRAYIIWNQTQRGVSVRACCWERRRERPCAWHVFLVGFQLSSNCQSEPGSHLQSLRAYVRREMWDKYGKIDSSRVAGAARWEVEERNGSDHIPEWMTANGGCGRRTRFLDLVEYFVTYTCQQWI